MGVACFGFSRVSNWDSQGPLGAVSLTIPAGAQSKQTPRESIQIGLWRCLHSLLFNLGRSPGLRQGISVKMPETWCSGPCYYLPLLTGAYAQGHQPDHGYCVPCPQAVWLRQEAVAQAVVITGCLDNQPLYMVTLGLPES